MCAFFISFSFFLKIESPAPGKTSAILNLKQSTPADNATLFHSLLEAQKQHCGPAAESSRAYNKTSKTAATSKIHANATSKNCETWKPRKIEERLLT